MSEVKVNKISPRAACGTVTLGDSGDTFTIPAGATITNAGTANGFGATGAVNWQTTVKTSGFTAVAGEGYFVDTSSGAISVNLPAGTAGAVVGFADYANNFGTNAVTLVQNGSDKIGGSTVNATLGVSGAAVTIVFVDATKGWIVTDSGNESDVPTAKYVTATGGNTITNSPCGNFKIHTFTAPGTFCVSCAGNPSGSTSVDYMVIAGGGGTGTAGAGGGGAGGYRESHSTPVSGCYVASPLATPTGITVTATGFPITVGGGGAGLPRPTPIPGAGGARGTNSTFSTITSTGGGGSPSQTESLTPTGPGGSGAGLGKGGPGPAGVGNTPPVSPPQGNNGGLNGPQVSGGGGGAGGVGTAGNPAIGGAGTTSSISGSAVTRAGGGGGGSDYPSNAGGPAHPGGGGGGQGGNRPDTNSTNGTDNTGGGGGGQGESAPCGTQRNGGSGVVIIRYKFQ
jgi:hypothetical protein